MQREDDIIFEELIDEATSNRNGKAGSSALIGSIWLASACYATFTGHDLAPIYSLLGGMTSAFSVVTAHRQWTEGQNEITTIKDYQHQEGQRLEAISDVVGMIGGPNQQQSKPAVQEARMPS